MAVEYTDAVVIKMDSDTRRELDLMWKHGVEEVRKDIREVRTEFRTEIKALSNGIKATNRWIVALIVTAIPTYVTAYFELKR